jgi:glycosyltransferase involved in cell wall biosynthesis
MPPAVSIVMPCHDALAHLPASVGSVLAQGFGDWELIAVDDGSRDGTLAWLRAQTDPRIRVHSQTNQGVSAARNAGLHLTRGNYVAFLDADDTWSPDFLARMHAALDSRPDAVLAYCGWQNLGLPGGRGEPFVPPDYETPDKESTLFAGCRWPIHAALTRTASIHRAGGFDTRLRIAEDYLLWLRLAGRTAVVNVPEVLANYHFHGGSQATANHVLVAIDFWRAQRFYLRENPSFARRLGHRRRRELTLGRLKEAGFRRYWAGDLDSARPIFRLVMRHGHGSFSDWKYMLPAWLPATFHARLVSNLRRPVS